MKKIIVILVILLLPVSYTLAAETGGGLMQIYSPVFKHNEYIPAKYTCEGRNINPELDIANLPEGTKTLALIVDDPDAPIGTWVHWVVFDIPVSNNIIKENSVPGVLGITNSGKKDYHGPCPPSGTHRYFFKVYALDTILNLKEGVSKGQLEASMQGHILAKAELIGLYKRGSNR